MCTNNQLQPSDELINAFSFLLQSASALFLGLLIFWDGHLFISSLPKAPVTHQDRYPPKMVLRYRNTFQSDSRLTQA